MPSHFQENRKPGESTDSRPWDADDDDSFEQQLGILSLLDEESACVPSAENQDCLTEESLEDILWESFFRNYLRPIWLARGREAATDQAKA